MKVKYVEFLFPGLLFSETSMQERNTDDPDSISIPKGAYGFRFCERTEGVIDGEKVLGGMQYQKGTFYSPGGRLLNLADVKAGKLGTKDVSILISNMEINKLETIIETNRGNIQEFTDNDRLLA